MPQRGICAVCKDASDPVSKDNGGTLSRTTGGIKQWVADVHKDCKAEWLRKNGAADYSGLEPR